MKMALACALPYRPRLLILDEPFSGLDPLVRDEFMEELLEQAGEMTILISSHDLGEIDGVATHVTFLDQGRLLFEEGMDELMDRFRQVRVTLEQEQRVPEQPPTTWLQLRAAGNVLTFVDTQFSEEDLGDQIRGLFASVRTIDAQPMTLRSILEVSAAMVTVDAGMSTFRGVLQADTVICNSIISASSTAGAGSAW